MKLLLIFVLLAYSFNVSALNCNVQNSTYSKLLKWQPPTYREKDNNGVSKKLPPSEIKGYFLKWEDINDINKKKCELTINVPSAKSAKINLQPGITYRFLIRTNDTGGRQSVDSNKVIFTTDGIVEKPTPTSPPQKVGNVKVKTFNLDKL